MFFKEYPAVATPLTSGISALIGRAIGWKIHRRRIDYDALVEHFKEMKNEVIRPLLHRINSQSYLTTGGCNIQ